MENNFLTIEPVALTAISTDKASTVEFGGPKWVVQRKRCYGNISGLCMMCLYINIYIILHHGFNYGACKSHYDLGAMFLIRVWSQFDMGLFLQWLPSTGRDVSDFRSLSRQITVLIQLLAFSLSCIFWCAAVDWICFYRTVSLDSLVVAVIIKMSYRATWKHIHNTWCVSQCLGLLNISLNSSVTFKK